MTNCPEYILIVRSAKYDKFNLKKESYEIVSKYANFVNRYSGLKCCIINDRSRVLSGIKTRGDSRVFYT